MVKHATINIVWNKTPLKITKQIKKKQLTEFLDGALSKLLWLEIDGVLCNRGGNDLLWCWRCECKGLGDTTSNGPLNNSVLMAWAGTNVAGCTVWGSLDTLQSWKKWK